MIGELLLTLVLLTVMALVLQAIVLLRERPTLVPVLLFGAVGMAIVGVTIAVVAPGLPFLSWFAPLGVLLTAHAIYRLYEWWGV